MQSRRHSLIEAAVNVVTGMIIAFVISQLAHVYEKEIQIYIWSGFTWSISPGSNLVMTIILTVISVARGYAWRRHFNKRLIKEKNNEIDKKSI
jgi:hypothetical protein